MAIVTPLSRPTETTPVGKQVSVVIIGPTPPPITGVSVLVELLVKVGGERGVLRLSHVETSDRSKAKNFGTFTVRNAIVAGRNLWRLGSALIRHRPKVAYLAISQDFWGFSRDAAFLAMARAFGCRTVIHLHGGYFDRFYQQAGPLLKGFIKVVLSTTSRAIVLGHCLRGIFGDLIPDDRVDVVPGGIDPWPDPGPKVSKASFDVLFAGVLVESKGFFDVIKSLPSVRERVPNIRFKVAGRWESEALRAEVMAFINVNGLDDCVEFLGVVSGDAKRELFAACDVFAIPTFYHLEGQPVAIIEAMASRLPVVASARGSIEETVVDGESGFMVTAQDLPAIADRLIRLAIEPGLAARMGECSRRLFEEHYTANTFVAGIEASLQKACSEPAR